MSCSESMSLFLHYCIYVPEQINDDGECVGTRIRRSRIRFVAVPLSTTPGNLFTHVCHVTKQYDLVK